MEDFNYLTEALDKAETFGSYKLLGIKKGFKLNRSKKDLKELKAQRQAALQAELDTKPKYGWTNKTINHADAVVTVYNNDTKQISIKLVYFNSKGYYFNAGSSKTYIKTF
jgi:hypothetical protein